LRSWAVFEGPIRNAIHALKYRRNLALGDTFARYLSEYVIKLGWQADLVIPVPLGGQSAEPAIAVGKSILLLDDVATTGATLAACSEALAASGAKTIYALTLAKALPRHGFQIV